MKKIYRYGTLFGCEFFFQVLNRFDYVFYIYRESGCPTVAHFGKEFNYNNKKYKEVRSSSMIMELYAIQNMNGVVLRLSKLSDQL